jgi:hypothetical protein
MDGGGMVPTFGNNHPMVYHYPRRFTYVPVDPLTQWGTTWVSNEIRYLGMDSSVPWQDYYDDGMIESDYRWRMRLRNALSGKPTLEGPFTQAIGSPSLKLRRQQIGVYMIPPRCVVGPREVTHG